MAVSVWLVLLSVTGSLAGVVVVPEEDLGDERACVQQDMETECAGEGATEWKMVWCRLVEEAKKKVRTKPNFKEILYLMNNDGAFTDLLDKYGKKEDKSKALMTHGKRLAILLLHHIDISKEDVPLGKIELGFKYIARHAPDNQDTNWWGHSIGTPKAMYPSAVLAKCLVDDYILEDYLNKYWRDTPRGPAWNLNTKNGTMSGGNLGSRALVAEVEGLVRGGQFMRDRHTSVTKELYRDLAEMKPYEDNGLRPDGCLHQHNMRELKNRLKHRLSLIYNGRYGIEMLMRVSDLFKLFRGLQLQYHKETIDKLFMAFFDCHQWLFRGHTFEPTSCGRFITTKKQVTQLPAEYGVNEVAATLQTLELSEYENKLDKVRDRYKNPIPNKDYALIGHKYFFNSDLSVHQRVGYMASVRVLSNRTCRPETYLNMNSDGYFQADGWLTVMVDGGEYGQPGKEVLLGYDWALVPGVTNLHMIQVPQLKISRWKAEHFYNNAGFVGGVTDGLVGLTTMDYNRIPVSVTALKSYFFFDDVVVVLGSRVTRKSDDNSGRHIVTTLAQMDLDSKNGATLGMSDGGEEEVSLGEELRDQQRPKYLHHRNIGYIFLNGDEVVHMKAEMRSEMYKTFTAIMDHGEMPNDASLAYAVYPGKTLEETKTLATDPGVQVLFNEPDLHVVCHKESKTVGAVLASAGQSVSVSSCGGVDGFTLSVDHPILALVKVTETQVIVTVADPTQTLTQVTFTLTFNGVDHKRVVTLPRDQVKGTSKVTTINI